MKSSNASLSSLPAKGLSEERRALVVAGIAHALHDGFTDMIYVLLPVWQTEFGLGYGSLALLRALYSGSMAGLQVSAASVADRFGGRGVLAIGTALAAFGFLLAGLTGTIALLCVALVVAGAGSSTQHPIGSAAVSRAYRGRAREPLGIYNFCGDIGKAVIPVGISLLITLMSWRAALLRVALLGLAVAIAIAVLMPSVDRKSTGTDGGGAGGRTGKSGGFPLLFMIGVLDTAVRMGFLTFLPFVLRAKGANLSTVGLGLSLVFIGGAAGKFACGWLGARIRLLGTVLITEGGTAVAILSILVLNLRPALIVLPLLGIMLNGTSSVLYGTVPELTKGDLAERSFALFYTGTIGSGAIAPVLYGALGDVVGASWATFATAMSALATIPLAIALSSRMAPD